MSFQLPSPQPPSYYMSLEVTQFQLASSPHYIMNNISTTSSHSGSPTSPAFILCPVSPAKNVSPVSTTDLSIDEDGIPRGIDIQDPVSEFMIMELPGRIHNPHIPYAHQAFPIFTTNPHQILPIPPLPLVDPMGYKVPYIHNSVYHITVSTDAPSIILDSTGLGDAKNFLFFLQQTILSRAYQVYSRPLNHHQMILIANLAITSYKNREMINLPAIQNNMINPHPNGLFSHSVRALYCHTTNKWLATLG